MNYEKYRKRHPVKMTLSMFLIYTVLELSVPAGILFALVCGNLRFFILQTLRISFIFANIAFLIIIGKMEEDRQDIRWKQRFQNFGKAFNRLGLAIEAVKKDPDNELLQCGLIQTYEFSIELAWKTLKDFLEKKGFMVQSPKSVIRQAYQSTYIDNVDDWLQALNDRDLTVHTYDDAVAAGVLKDINKRYFFMLEAFYKDFKARI